MQRSQIVTAEYHNTRNNASHIINKKIKILSILFQKTFLNIYMHIYVYKISIIIFIKKGINVSPCRAFVGWEPRSRCVSVYHGPDKRSWFSRPRPLPAAAAAAFSRRRRRCLHEGTYPPEIPEATTAAPRLCMHTEWNGAISSKFSWRGNKWSESLDLYAREAPVRKADKSASFLSCRTERHLYGDATERYRISARLYQSWILACESRRPLTVTRRSRITRAKNLCGE